MRMATLSEVRRGEGRKGWVWIPEWSKHTPTYRKRKRKRNKGTGRPTHKKLSLKRENEQGQNVKSLRTTKFSEDYNIATQREDRWSGGEQRTSLEFLQEEVKWNISEINFSAKDRNQKWAVLQRH